MRGWRRHILMLGAMLMSITVLAQREAVPKYDRGAEAVFKGTVIEVKDRVCPVSGGMGSHITLQLADGSSLEVHLAASKFVRQYELVFQKGDVVEVTGVKVKFEGVDTIFARKIKRGQDEFLFRDADGKRLW
jgi:DNA/RNA endonuclease YhcR with UshA esterase domain